MKLTVKTVLSAKPAERKYRLSDGGGLAVLIHPNGSKYWLFRYRRPANRKEAELNLGVFPTVTLARARELREEAKRTLADGIDPGAVKRARGQAEDSSFEALAREAIEKIAANAPWSPRHRARQESHMERHIYPWIGQVPTDQLGTPDIARALDRVVDAGKSATAIKVKSLIGQVLRYGAARGRCTRDVTADLRGQYTKGAVNHRAAIITPSRFGELLRAMDSYSGEYKTRAALKLSPLTFPRPNVLRLWEWAEIDWDKEQWEIPAYKMKMRNPHIVPLCSQALAVLNDLAPLTRNRSRYVFPSNRGASRPMSDNTVRTALVDLGFKGDDSENFVSGAGFRPSARTMLVEQLQFPEHWVKMQIGHVVKDIHGRAYDRTTFLPERREMMQAWGDYLDELRQLCTPVAG